MPDRVAFFTVGRRERLPVRLKFWERAGWKKAAPMGCVGEGVQPAPRVVQAGLLFPSASLTTPAQATDNAPKPPEASVGDGKGIQATIYFMQTFQEFLAKKAVVLPDPFRIQPFVGLTQPIPLMQPRRRPRTPGRRLKGVQRGLRVPKVP
jgi:hypothetical protein